MESLNTLITNSTFNTEHSMNGFHTLKLTEYEHKALKSIIAENEKLKRKINKTVEYMNECCIKNMSEGGVRGFQSWETRCIGSRLIDEIFSSDDEDEEDVD